MTAPHNDFTILVNWLPVAQGGRKVIPGIGYRAQSRLPSGMTRTMMLMTHIAGDDRAFVYRATHIAKDIHPSTLPTTWDLCEGPRRVAKVYLIPS